MASTKLILLFYLNRLSGAANVKENNNSLAPPPLAEPLHQDFISSSMFYILIVVLVGLIICIIACLYILLCKWQQRFNLNSKFNRIESFQNIKLYKFSFITADTNHHCDDENHKSYNELKCNWRLVKIIFKNVIYIMQ